MLALECIFGGHKFLRLFSMPTLELKEQMNFLKKMCPSTDPREPRNVSLDLCLERCAYVQDYILWEQPVQVQHIQFKKLLCTFLSLLAEFWLI